MHRRKEHDTDDQGNTNEILYPEMGGTHTGYIQQTHMTVPVPPPWSQESREWECYENQIADEEDWEDEKSDLGLQIISPARIHASSRFPARKSSTAGRRPNPLSIPPPINISSIIPEENLHDPTIANEYHPNLRAYITSGRTTPVLTLTRHHPNSSSTSTFFLNSPNSPITITITTPEDDQRNFEIVGGNPFNAIRAQRNGNSTSSLWSFPSHSRNISSPSPPPNPNLLMPPRIYPHVQPSLAVERNDRLTQSEKKAHEHREIRAFLVGFLDSKDEHFPAASKARIMGMYGISEADLRQASTETRQIEGERGREGEDEGVVLDVGDFQFGFEEDVQEHRKEETRVEQIRDNGIVDSELMMEVRRNSVFTHARSISSPTNGRHFGMISTSREPSLVHPAFAYSHSPPTSPPTIPLPPLPRKPQTPPGSQDSMQTPDITPPKRWDSLRHIRAKLVSASTLRTGDTSESQTENENENGKTARVVRSLPAALPHLPTLPLSITTHSNISNTNIRRQTTPNSTPISKLDISRPILTPYTYIPNPKFPPYAPSTSPEAHTKVSLRKEEISLPIPISSTISSEQQFPPVVRVPIPELANINEIGLTPMIKSELRRKRSEVWRKMRAVREGP